VERTGDFNDEIANDAAPAADGVLDHATAFDAAVDMFNPHPSPGHGAIVGFLLRRELSTPRFLDRLVDRHSIQRTGKNAEILEQLTAIGQGIGAVIRNPFIMHASFKRRTEHHDLQAAIDQEEVFQRMVFGLAAIVERLFNRVRGARDGALGGIMAKWGAAASSGGGPSSEIWGAMTSVFRRSASATWFRLGASPVARRVARKTGKRVCTH